MKRINLFFLSLLACLLVGANTWGADYAPIVPINPNHTYKIQFARSGCTNYYASICNDGSKDYLGGVNEASDFSEASTNFTFEAVGNGQHYIKTSSGKYLRFTQATPTANDAKSITLVDTPDDNCKWTICQDHCESSESIIADGVDIIPNGSVGAQKNGNQFLGYDYASSGTPNRTGINFNGGVKNKRSLGMYRRSEAGSVWRLIENVTPELIGKAFTLTSRNNCILYCNDGTLQLSSAKQTSSIWIVEQKEDNNHCALRNATTGKYVKFATGTSNAWTLADSNNEDATFIISPRVVNNVTYYTVNYDISKGFAAEEWAYSMHDPNNGTNKPVTWEPGNTNSQWTFEEVSLPTFSTYEDPVWHTWKMRKGYGKIDIDSYYPESNVSPRPETDPAYQFAFIGYPWHFQIIDAKGQYLTKVATSSSSDNLFKGASSSDLYLQIQKTTNATYTNGKITFLKEGTTNHISNDIGGKLGFWINNDAAKADAGSQLTIEPSLENGEEIEIYYIDLKGAPDDAVVTYNGKQITNATTFKAIATSTPAGDIELEVSVAGYTYETELVGSTFTITFTPSTTYEYTVHVYGSATGEATYGGNNYANGATITLADNPIVEANIGATDDGTHKFVRAEVEGAHVNIFYAVTAPTEGKAYYLANLKPKDNKVTLRYYTYTSGSATGWSDVISSSTAFIAKKCKDAQGNDTTVNSKGTAYYMMTPDGKFLTWRGNGEGCNDNKGWAPTYNKTYQQTNNYNDWTHLAFISHTTDGYNSKTYSNVVSVYGRRNKETTFSNIVVETAGSFNKANEKQFFNDTYSSAFYLIEATDVKTTEVTFEAYDKTTKISVPTSATATYGGVTVPWACPYFRAENITSGVTAGEVTGYTSTVDYMSGVKVTYNRQTVTYNVYKDNAESGDPIWTKTYYVAKGAAYPDCEKPNNFITWTNFPTGNVGSTSETITLKYETTFKCYKSYNDIETFYSLYIKPKKEDGSVDSDGAYIYNNGSLECKSSGYDKTDLGFFFGFVGDIFTGKVKVYTYDGYYLNSSDPCGLTKDANAFEWTLKNPNGLNITSNTIFALQQNENDDNTFINLQSSQLKRYANDRGGAIKIVDNQNIKNVTITIAASGLSTLCLDYNAILPDNTYAYVASAYSNQQVTLSKVNSRYIKAEVGYIIKGERETRPSVTFFQTPKEVEEPVTNYMKGVLQATVINNSGSDKYVMSGGLFCPIKDQTTLPANKAYLDLSSFADGNKVKGFSLDDDPTSIYDVDLKVENDKIYNLAGQRVNKLQKGINIVNGQKVYVK